MKTFHYLSASTALLAAALALPAAAQGPAAIREALAITAHLAVAEDGERALGEIRHDVQRSLRALQPLQGLLQSLSAAAGRDALHVAAREQHDGS